ncbi:MAG TPA: hypothetical protein VH082_04275 [Rudaea sp.]|jgi:hypothetical protein|nr:hypothetical protein [Rudaea sp.]
MPDIQILVPVLIGVGIVFFLISLTHLFAARRHWRARRRFHTAHRLVWLLVCLIIAVLSFGLGLSLRGYRLLTQESHVATISSRQLGPQQFAVRVDFPDGTHQSADLRGDEWQLDARVLKWTPRAVEMGAKPMYRLDRLSGRYHDTTQAQTTPPSAVSLDGESAFDLWHMKKQFPEWLPMVDADYGSGAYLPLVNDGKYDASVSSLGGLIARPADEATAQKIKATGW